MFHSQCFLSIVAILIIPIDGNQNPPQKFPLDPPPLPQNAGQAGCPPKMLPPPSPRFSFFMNGPPPPLFCTKQGTTPPSFQFQKVRSAWNVRQEGEGGLPLRLWTRGVGYLMVGVGVHPAPPEPDMPPTPLPSFFNVGGWGGSLLLKKMDGLLADGSGTSLDQLPGF